MTAYYNENDPFAAAWLRELIDAGHIAFGIVDERSIEDVRPYEIAGYTQCHFFAGIGVWSYALRQAGWADDRPVWTGSCPCQPFSQAGKGGGFDDERHLWPAFHWLIEECRPAIILGEQVANKTVEPWIDLVQSDLETLGYAFGCIPFPSAGVGAPHIRDRTYWAAAKSGALADALRAGPLSGAYARIHRGEESAGSRDGEPERSGADGRLADAHHAGLEGRLGVSERANQCAAGAHGVDGRLADAASERRDGGQDTARPRGWTCIEADGPVERLAYADGGNASTERQQHGGEQRLYAEDGSGMREGHQGARSDTALGVGASPTNGFWSDADWLFCRDGKFRPVEPGTFPLVDGAPARVGRLRGYGNAVNAEAAKVWIETVRDCL